MTNNRKDILRLLIFIETLKVEEPLMWSIPCVGFSDSFDIEWDPFDRGTWKYKQGDMDEWIEIATFNLLPVLEKNNVNLNMFKNSIVKTILNKVTYAYNIVQEACGIFGEDTVYKNIEDEHDLLMKEIEKIIGRADKPNLRVIKTKE